MEKVQWWLSTIFNLGHLLSGFIVYMLYHHTDFLMVGGSIAYGMWIHNSYKDKDREVYAREMTNAVLVIFMYVIFCVTFYRYPAYAFKSYHFKKVVDFHKSDAVEKLDKILLDKMGRVENAHNTFWSNVDNKMSELDKHMSTKFASQLASKI